MFVFVFGEKRSAWRYNRISTFAGSSAQNAEAMTVNDVGRGDQHVRIKKVITMYY